MNNNRPKHAIFDPLSSKHPNWMWKVRTVVGKIQDKLHYHAMILDIGAGRCELAEYLSANFRCEVIALDICIEGFLKYKQRVKLRGEPKYNSLHLIIADGRKLPFRTGVFDAAYYWATLHHMPNYYSSLLEVRKVLKKRGTLLLYETNALSPFRKLDEFFYRVKGEYESSFLPFIIKKNISSLFILKYFSSNYEYFGPFCFYGATSIYHPPLEKLRNHVKRLYHMLTRKHLFSIFGGAILIVAVKP